MLHSFNWPNFIVWCLYFWRITQYVSCNYLFPSWWRGNLNYLTGSKRVITKKVITLAKKVITKILIFYERKRLLRWNLKNFSLLLKGVYRSKLFQKQHFLVWARPWTFSFSQKSIPAHAKITKARVLSGKSYLVR